MHNNPLTSGRYLLQGFKLLTHPKLRLFVLIPLLINTILFTALILLSIHQFQHLVAWIDHLLPHWLRWLNWLLWLLFAFATLIVLAYGFNIIANLIGAPFNSLLAAKTEELLTSHTPTDSFKETLADIPRILKHEVEKILYYLPRALLCLLLFFIPIIQIAAPFIWFLFNSWMMSLQYLDYPMDNHKLGLRKIKKQLQAQRSACLSFGATTMLATMIPIINFIVMPSAVVGATIFWLEKYRDSSTI